jgi:hypothetical protein
MLDLNRSHLSIEPLNVAINAAIEASVVRKLEAVRLYLGMSQVGNVCARRVQFDWFVAPTHAARLQSIFARGHFFEAESRQLLIDAGFEFAPSEALAITTLDGAFRGHADGKIVRTPKLENSGLICPALWEHKAVNAKNWKAIERDGLIKTFPQYATQIALYQAYLDVTNPCLVTIVNADSCERLHFTIPFNAERAQAGSDRALAIIQASRAGELLPRFTDDRGDWRCKMCPHEVRCWERNP